MALDWAAASSATDLPAYEALLEDLEHAGLLNREVEALPTEEELSRRQQAGAGLSRPGAGRPFRLRPQRAGALDRKLFPGRRRGA